MANEFYPTKSKNRGSISRLAYHFQKKKFDHSIMHFGYSNKSKQKEKCYKINLPRKEIENLESSRKKAKNSKTI